MGWGVRDQIPLRNTTHTLPLLDIKGSGMPCNWKYIYCLTSYFLNLLDQGTVLQGIPVTQGTRCGISIPSGERWYNGVLGDDGIGSRSGSTKYSVLNIHWKGWCWSWSSNTLATWCEEPTHLKRPWCWEGLGTGGEGDNRVWDDWMASLTQWTWVWVNSGNWWWRGKPAVHGVTESDTTERLNWTEQEAQSASASLSPPDSPGLPGPRLFPAPWQLPSPRGLRLPSLAQSTWKTGFWAVLLLASLLLLPLLFHLLFPRSTS